MKVIFESEILNHETNVKWFIENEHSFICRDLTLYPHFMSKRIYGWNFFFLDMCQRKKKILGNNI